MSHAEWVSEHIKIIQSASVFKCSTDTYIQVVLPLVLADFF